MDCPRTRTGSTESKKLYRIERGTKTSWEQLFTATGKIYRDGYELNILPFVKATISHTLPKYAKEGRWHAGSVALFKHVRHCPLL